MEFDGLVSVVMPAYNSQAYITEAIQSVIQQTYKNWELFVIDDASSDRTVELILQLASKDTRIRLLKNPVNSGTHYSRNRGIEEARGDYIAFLDADDLWKPKKLSKQIKVLSKPNVAACYSSYELIDENGQHLEQMVCALPVLHYRKLLKANYVGNLTGMYNVKILGKIYSAEISRRQDWALWLQVIDEGGPMEGIQASLAYYRVRKDSLSTNKIRMLKYNFLVYHQVLKFGFLKSLWRMLIFLNEQFFVKSRQLRSISKER